jgi:hypothetical protein
VREDELTAVFFGKGLSANPEAEVLKALLASAGIESVIRWTPPTFQHRDGISLLVVESQREDALSLIEQAQIEGEAEMSKAHPKGEFVTVFSSSAHDAESEADTIHSLLESAGLQSVIVRENVQELPTGGVEVRVLPDEADEARELIAEALETGWDEDEDGDEDEDWSDEESEDYSDEDGEYEDDDDYDDEDDDDR